MYVATASKHHVNYVFQAWYDVSIRDNFTYKTNVSALNGDRNSSIETLPSSNVLNVI